MVNNRSHTDRVKGKSRVYRGLKLVKRESPSFYVSGTYRGVRVRRCTLEEDRDRALAVMRDIMAEIDSEQGQASEGTDETFGIQSRDVARLQNALKRLSAPVLAHVLGGLALPSSKPKRTIQDACNGYLDAVNPDRLTRRCVERLRDFFGATLLCEEFTNDHLRRAFDKLGGPQVKKATLKRQVMSPLRAALTWAASEWGPVQGCSRPAFPPMSDGERRDRVVTPEEAATVLSLARSRCLGVLEAVLVVALCEGPRRADLFALEWEHIDLRHGVMNLRDRKSQRGVVRHHRIDDLRPRTLRALREIRPSTGVVTGRVFRRDDGSPFPSEGAFGTEMNDAMRGLATELDLPRIREISLHMLRHSATSWAYVVEPDIERVRIRMGWTTPKMAFRYVHLLPRQHKAEVLRFWEVDGN